MWPKKTVLHGTTPGEDAEDAVVESPPRTEETHAGRGDKTDTEDICADPQTAGLTEEQREEIADSLTGSGETLKARVDAIEQMYRELQRLGEATSDYLVAVIDPEEVRFTGGKKTSPEVSSWSNLVKGKGTLSELSGVKKPPVGNETWRFRGEHE